MQRPSLPEAGGVFGRAAAGAQEEAGGQQCRPRLTHRRHGEEGAAEAAEPVCGGVKETEKTGRQLLHLNLNENPILIHTLLDPDPVFMTSMKMGLTN